MSLRRVAPGPMSLRRLALLAWAVAALGWMRVAAVQAAPVPGGSPAGAGGPAAPQPAALTVELLAQAETTGPVVLLGEVVRLVEGDEAAFDELASIPVGTAPLPGELRTLPRGQIELRLRQARVDPQRLRWAGENTVVEVRRVAVAVPDSAIVQRINEHLGGALRVGAVEDLPPLFMPPGPVQVRVVSAPPVLRPGSAVFVVELSHGSGLVRRAWVRVRLEPGAGISVAGQLPASGRPAPTGQEPAGGLPAGRLLASARPEPLGRSVSASPAPGPAPGSGAVGGAVVLVARRGAVWVEADGVLLEDAPVGALVNVLNVATGQVVRAMRVAPDRAVALGEAGTDG